MPPIGLDELADVLLGGAGEGALLVAEQDALDQIVGDGAAIDGDEGLASGGRRSPGWRGRPVPCRRRIRLRSGSGCWTRPPSGRAGCTRSIAGLRVTRSRKVSRPLPRRALRWTSPSTRLDLERIGDRGLQPLGRGRLDDEIEGAGAHGRNHGLDAAVRGLDDDRNGDAALAHRLQHADAVEVGHRQVEDDHADVAPRRARRACASAASPPSATIAAWPNFVTAASSSRRCTGSSSTMRMEPVMICPEYARLR